MVILDQTDPPRLKIDLDNKSDLHTRVRKHCTSLSKEPWKEKNFAKKRNHGVSFHTAHAIMHSKNNCAKEGLN